MPKLNLKTIKPILRSVFKQYAVEFAYVFGSYAAQNVGPLSDLDIAVYFSYQKMPKKEDRDKLIWQVRDDIAGALKIGEKIDVICLNDATPLMLREVVYKGKIIYNTDDGKRAHFESWAISQWLDWKWYEDQFNKAILENIDQPVAKYAK